MPSLAAAITTLSPAATPIARGATYGGKAAAVPRTYSSTFTFLKAGALPGIPRGSFAGKAASSSESKLGSDTYIAVLNFGPTTDLDVDVTDSYVPRLTFSGTVGVARTVTDTYSIRATFAKQSLLATGSTPVGVSDSYVPKLTLSGAIRVPIAGADSYVPKLTLSGSKLAANATNGTDTYIPVIRVSSQTLKQQATVDISRSDTYVPVLTLNGSVKRSGDVDRIEISSRPTGRIQIRET